MNKTILLTSISLLAISSMSFAEGQKNGEELTKSLCVSCHVTKGKGKVAPPLIAVKRHVQKAYQSKEDFVDRIVEWVEEPDEAIALMPGAIKKFGVMPKLDYDSEDVRVIANYLYEAEIEQPKWFKKHFEEKHGKDGMSGSNN